MAAVMIEGNQYEMIEDMKSSIHGFYMETFTESNLYDESGWLIITVSTKLWQGGYLDAI